MTTLTRRDALRAAMVGVAAVGAGPVLGGAAPAAAASSGASFVPASADLHLLRRATFGPTPDLARSVRKLGRGRWLAQQLNPAGINDAFCDRLMAERFPRLKWSITEARAGLTPFAWDLMFDLGMATITRSVWSKRQLFEVMCDFWSNHLNVTNPSDGVWDKRHHYDRTVIRKHALGRFEDMLVASATHPAMLLYLNNESSTKVDPNENYGRELLELHSVGSASGFTEQDMRNSTLIMTGFSVDWRSGLFQYRGDYHYRGPVRVLGFRHDNATADGGYNVGVAYVRYLARHPATARAIAAKLVQRFVSDEPQPALVKALAQTYLANKTAIKPVLKQLFTSKAFAQSVGAKTRRPFEDVAATLRILGYRPDASGKNGLRGLYWLSRDLGHVPLGWTPPDGYPDTAAAWQSAGGTLARWNMHLSLAAHWWPKELVQPELRSLLPKRLPATYGGLLDALARRLVFRPLAPRHRNDILAFLGRNAWDPLGATDAAVGWRLPHVVALILDSPYHGVR